MITQQRESESPQAVLQNDVIETAMAAYDFAHSDESTDKAAFGIATYIIMEGLRITTKAACLMLDDALKKRDV